MQELNHHLKGLNNSTSMLEQLFNSYPMLEHDLVNVVQIILDSLVEHIAVVDKSGEIIITNEAWNKFTRENASDSHGRYGVGANYLEVCKKSNGRDKSAEAFYFKLKSVLAGKKNNFTLEYACHSETEKRWFLVTVTPFKIGHKIIGAIVSHFNITRRKLAELHLKRQATTDSLTRVMNRNTGLNYLKKKVK